MQFGTRLPDAKVSEGCRNCYAERMSKRLAGRCGYPKDDPFKVTLHPDKLGEPLKWKKPRRIFVNSMSDLFHPDVPDSFIHEVLWYIWFYRRHTFIVLTKRPERVAGSMFQLRLFSSYWRRRKVPSLRCNRKAYAQSWIRE